jgi:hypothetical protein
MNLGIFFWILDSILMPNSLVEISKISFREEFSSQIDNSYDARSKQNGLPMIYRIYLKSFTIFNDL